MESPWMRSVHIDVDERLPAGWSHVRARLRVATVSELGGSHLLELVAALGGFGIVRGDGAGGLGRNAIASPGSSVNAHIELTEFAWVSGAQLVAELLVFLQEWLADIFVARALPPRAMRSLPATAADLAVVGADDAGAVQLVGGSDAARDDRHGGLPAEFAIEP